MAGLDDALNSWLEDVKKVAEMTPTDQAKITKAGADELQKVYTDVTREKHYSSHEDKKYGHMADHVTKQATNIDGVKNGVSSVGWDNPYHAMNARRLNDGTKKYSADHFVDDIRDDPETAEKVVLAQQAEYQKLLKKIEGGD